MTEEDKAKIVGSIKDIDDMESNLFHSLNKTSQPKKSLGKTKKSKLSETHQQKQPRVAKKVSFEDEEFDEQEQELMREINKGLAASNPVKVSSSPSPTFKPQEDTTAKKSAKSGMLLCTFHSCLAICVTKAGFCAHDSKTHFSPSQDSCTH